MEPGKTGHRYRCYPSANAAAILIRWIGCQRFIYNAKVGEDRYFRAFARKSLSMAGQSPPVDQRYAQFVTQETAFLREVPSQILRIGAVRWRNSYARFFAKLGGRPVIRKPHGQQTVLLTRDLFRFEPVGAASKEGGLVGDWRLFVGTKKFPVGEIRYVADRPHKEPASITLTLDAGHWYVSFSDEADAPEYAEEDIAAWLATMPATDLAAATRGADLGTVNPLAASDGEMFDFSKTQKKRRRKRTKAKKRHQRMLARRQMASKRRAKTKRKIAVIERKERQIRRDFAHQTSHRIVRDPQTLLIAFEDVKIKNMTRSARGTADAPGRNVAAKAGLNRSILEAAWGFVRTFSRYKARKEHKLVVLVPPAYSSQECAACGHISQDNRIDQSRFVCQACGHEANADVNAAKVLAKRGLELVSSGSFKPKERKRLAKFTRVRRDPPERAMGKTGADARGEHVRRVGRKASAQRSANRETNATAIGT